MNTECRLTSVDDISLALAIVLESCVLWFRYFWFDGFRYLEIVVRFRGPTIREDPFSSWPGVYAAASAGTDRRSGGSGPALCALCVCVCVPVWPVCVPPPLRASEQGRAEACVNAGRTHKSGRRYRLAGGGPLLSLQTRTS